MKSEVTSPAVIVHKWSDFPSKRALWHSFYFQFDTSKKLLPNKQNAIRQKQKQHSEIAHRIAASSISSTLAQAQRFPK